MRDTAWLKQRACVGTDVAVFFDADGTPAGRALCASCPVRAACLDDALITEQHNNRHGYRGGLSPSGRDREFRARPLAPVACDCGCGTVFVPASPSSRYVAPAHRMRAWRQARTAA